MKSLAMLSLALPIALFATACNHTADDMSAAEPAAAPAGEPAPAAATAPMPAPAAPTVPEPATTPMDSGAAFQQMDENGDGGITQEELAATDMLYQHFGAADTDADGMLSPAEVDAHRAAMAAPTPN